MAGLKISPGVGQSDTSPTAVLVRVRSATPVTERLTMAMLLEKSGSGVELVTRTVLVTSMSWLATSRKEARRRPWLSGVSGSRKFVLNVPMSDPNWVETTGPVVQVNCEMAPPPWLTEKAQLWMVTFPLRARCRR